MSVDDYAKHYADHYGSDEQTYWRELGARDKAANVISMWAATGEARAPRVADIGCGEGALIAELGKRGFGADFVGFEISSSGVAAASKRTFGRPTRIELYDGHRTPAGDQEFDVAVLSHVIEHVENPRGLLREAARIARYVFVEVPLELHTRTPRHFAWTELGHVNLYNPLVIRQLVESIGATVIGEQVTCPCREAMVFRREGLRSELRYVVMTSVLRVWPSLACQLWSFHGSLIARSPTASAGARDGLAASGEPEA